LVAAGSIHLILTPEHFDEGAHFGLYLPGRGRIRWCRVAGFIHGLTTPAEAALLPDPEVWCADREALLPPAGEIDDELRRRLQVSIAVEEFEFPAVKPGELARLVGPIGGGREERNNQGSS
jgi:hypothetical protein